MKAKENDETKAEKENMKENVEEAEDKEITTATKEVKSTVYENPTHQEIKELSAPQKSSTEKKKEWIKNGNSY